MEKRHILSCFEFFQKAPPELQAEMERTSSYVSLPEATYCFYEADQCKAIALLGAGLVRVYKSSPEGREVTLYHVGPGDLCLLTLQAALSGEKFAATAVTRTGVEALLLPVEAFRSWVDRYAFLRSLVFATMSKRVAELMVLVQEIAFRRLDQRLAAFLLERLDGDGDDRGIAVTHERIATELGTAREVVSRLLKDLEHLGIVELGRGELRVRDRGGLTRMVVPGAPGAGLAV